MQTTNGPHLSRNSYRRVGCTFTEIPLLLLSPGRRQLVILCFAAASLILVKTSSAQQDWVLTSAPISDYISVASSADGSKIVALAGVSTCTSTNYGTTWVTRSTPNQAWYFVASSADGTRLAAAANGLGSYLAYNGVYVSTNFGVSWTKTSFPGTNPVCVASSAGGSTLVVVDTLLYTSTDSGVNWSTGTPPPASSAWRWAACSADGSKLVATTLSSTIYVSTNSGARWDPTTAPAGLWDCIASSADGSQLVASMNKFSQGGQLYTSRDCGATWFTNHSPAFAWDCIASSADGSLLTVVMKRTYYTPSGGPIYFSTNSGSSWLPANAPTTNWLSVASSADGSRLVAVVQSGGIYTSQSAPAPQLSTQAAGSNLNFSWTIPSTPFVLQEGVDLVAPNWTDITNSLTTTNLQNQIVLPAPPANRFYRLRGAFNE